MFDQRSRELGDDPMEFVCKLDVDLILPPRYFERLLEEMALDERLGSVFGKALLSGSAAKDSHELKSERIGDDVSAGMTKFYRRSLPR